MKKILFVDDEPHVLEGLQRILLTMHRDWQMGFALSGPLALEMLQHERYDVVVSDMRMPGMDGAQLLAEVKKRYPDSIRFVLSGQSESELVYRSVGEAHQFLSKPCKPKLLKECVDRAFALRDLLLNDSLKSLVAQLETLPPVPELYTKLCETLRSPDCTVALVGQIMETDQAMTAKILQVTNSAFFALRQEVNTAAHAVSLLGLDTIKALVLTTGIFAPLEGRSFSEGFSIDKLWKHSMLVGTYAKAISERKERSKADAGDAYTAGLLHDIGKLVLASVCTDDYARVHAYATEEEVTLQTAEAAILGCTHSEIGAYLLGIWGLPDVIIESVAYHHRPAESIGSEFSPLAAVHVANVLAHTRHRGNSMYAVPQLDAAYLERIGLAGESAAWEETCAQIDARGSVS